MSVVCRFCNALKWPGENNGMCCSSGKVSLPFLQPPPETLNSLLHGTDNISKKFLKDIRKYNAAFQMTSFGANVVHENKFMPTFKVQGQIYHRIGSLLPTTNQEPKFLQIYFIEDPNEQATIRCQYIGNIDQHIVSSLQGMLHEVNKYVQEFKTALENAPSDEFKVVIRADKKPEGGHKGRFNAPSCNEIAVVISGQEFEKRDIIIHSRDNRLQKLSETHRSYDALQYPLLFSRGEDGYHFQVFQVQPVTGQQGPKKMSCMNFYAYRLQVRNGEHNHLHYSRKLFGQFIVDMYVKVETERLLYVRLNQKKLRVDSYNHLQDAINQDGYVSDIGQMVILPSSFTGGPRYMHEKTQDAISYVRNYGRPDLFITFTTNPKWKEIRDVLFEGQSAQDRPDVVARVFHLKVKSMMDFLTKGHIFGPHRCFIYSIEWQKRGLPHVHILLWLQERIRSQRIDSFISAEFPNPQEDPELFEIIKGNMVHGPCGNFNKFSPCMVNGKCSKRYPRPLLKETQTDVDGYPSYRRRRVEDGGYSATIKTRSGNLEVDNKWVVPYCPVLSRTFKAHINVESCQSVKSIKYVCKYINKGSDQATFAVRERDEVQVYQTGRYVSCSEAVWRLLGFPIHERYPPVTHLQVHLENGQRVYFTDENVQEKLNAPQRTTLTSFFELCREDDFAKTLLYDEVPQYYTFTAQKKFAPRKIGVNVPGTNVMKSYTIGRVYTVHPNNTECYYLRILLHTVRGPTSFENLRTVNGHLHPTYQEACRALGLLEDDQQWHNTMNEAAAANSADSLRHLFAVILSKCRPGDPKSLWQEYRESLSEDILHNARRENPDNVIEYTEEMFNQALCMIEDIVLQISSNTLQSLGLQQPNRDMEVQNDRDYLREKSYNIEELLAYVTENKVKLNEEQKIVYQEIMHSIDNRLGKTFFMDAPGGTGKTFLTNLILAKLRSQSKIALAVASSGIAATLLKGGRTAHSTFKLPINLLNSETPTCNILKNSSAAKLLRECEIIIWDECTMSNKLAAEALNRTLQDIRNNSSLMGGLTVVFSGDFRQTLPIIRRGTRADEINACLKFSFIWRSVNILALKKNMRVHNNPDKHSEEFANLLLDIGNGRIQSEDDLISIQENLGTVVESMQSLVNKVYPDLKNWKSKPASWWRERCILAARNDYVKAINEHILLYLNSEERTYTSVDTVIDQDKAVEFPVEFLNSLELPQLQPHKLILKTGAIVMLLRNLDAPRLCNGTRLRITQLKNNVIEAEVITGCATGEMVFIPKIPLIPSGEVYEFKRVQFPIRLCFAMTINKSQGQSLKVAGLDLRNPCFSHGQFYVACSRVSSSKSLFFLSSQKTTNIVHQEVLR